MGRVVGAEIRCDSHIVFPPADRALCSEAASELEAMGWVCCTAELSTAGGVLLPVVELAVQAAVVALARGVHFVRGVVF